MTEACARSILRLIAVTVIVVGVCLAVSSLVVRMGISNHLGGVHIDLAELMGLGTTAPLSMAGVGAVLFWLSPRLAPKIVA